MFESRHGASGQRVHRGLAVLALSAIVALGGCAPGLQVDTAETGEQSTAVINAAIIGKKNVGPEAEINLGVESGRFTDVTVSGPKGEVAGSFEAGGTRWRADAADLAFGTTYTVKAAAVDLRGRPVLESGSFRTLKPEAVLEPDVYPWDGGTYGVGIPITVTFNQAVADRAAVQERLSVRASNPVVGSWHWDSDTSVTYRPKDYWPAYTDVTLSMNLRGVKAAKGIYGVRDETRSFAIGSSMVSIADAGSHYMTVRRDGAVLRTIPITTGKPGWETRSGIKVIMSKEPHVVMDASTLGVGEGDDDYYRLDVDNAMRLTWSGEFIHAAPWSVSSQGVANVSHGCIGMSDPNAAWMFGSSKIGDVVQVVNTGRTQDLGNGITVWNVPWSDWKAGSAL